MNLNSRSHDPCSGSMSRWVYTTYILSKMAVHPVRNVNSMRAEYDFSKGKRGSLLQLYLHGVVRGSAAPNREP